MQMIQSQFAPAFGLKKGALMLHGIDTGTVTKRMIFERAVELAAIHGSSYHAITKDDWNQARRELTGNSETEAKEEIIDSAPESERWDTIHGSDGSMTPVSHSEDEDEGGHSDSARLVEEGIGETARDQMLQAANARKTS
jgi:hypothetical protein